MAHDVFISYAIEDKAVADAVCQALEKGGIRCWYAPRDIPYAVEYEDAIVDAISESQLMVLILSAHSNNSKDVKHEVKQASRKERVPVLPFQLENIELNKSLDYYIGSVQWLSAVTPPLEAHLQELVEYAQGLRTPEQDSDSGTQGGQSAKADINGEDKKARPGTEKERPGHKAESLGAAARSLQASLEEKQTTPLNLSPVTTAPHSGKRKMLLVGVTCAVVLALIFLGWRQWQQPSANRLMAEDQTTRGKGIFPPNSTDPQKAAEAEPYFREAVRLQPDDAWYYSNLGLALYHQQKFAEAAYYLRQTARLWPNDDVTLNNLGNALFNQRDPLKYPEAETAFRAAIKLSRSNPIYHANLGKALVVQKKYAEARLAYQNAQNLDPGNTEYQEALDGIPKN